MSLPKATLQPAPGERAPLRIRPKHVVALFGLLSLGGMVPSLLAFTLYLPPLGLFFDLLWVTPVVLPLFVKRMTTFKALACLGGFIGQAVIIEMFEALSNLAQLRLGDLVTTIGVALGLVAAIVNLAKPDPDPDFVPNEFTIR